jgi:cell wall-associated NlpC family hydrolase
MTRPLTLGAGCVGAFLALTLVVSAVGQDQVSSTSSAPGNPGTGLKTGLVPAEYEALILAAGQECPEASAPILAAQLKQESGFNPRAVSPVGAQGIAQFMPGTWPGVGRDENGDGRANPFDPADAIPAQARYDCGLAQQIRGYIQDGRVSGDVTQLMLASYNAGVGSVLRAGGIPQNGETPAYVTRIISSAADYAAVRAVGGASSSFGAAVVATAMQYNNKLTYVWGGGNFNGPTGGGFDCSGLVLFAVYQASSGQIKLPHQANIQRTMGQPVNRADMVPGDVIAFAYPGSSSYHHIGIYLGSNQMIHAPTFGKPVQTTNLTLSYWTSQTWQVRRFG